MKIFIASSGRKKRLAKRISENLKSEGFESFGWWEDYTFPLGDYTLTRLIELTDICDGAIFIFGNDDVTWMNNKFKSKSKIEKIKSVRDNVLLEYGLFVSKIGLSNCPIIKSRGTHIPSNLHGITYTVGRTSKDTSKRIIKHFTKQKTNSTVYDRVIINSSTSVPIKAMQYKSFDWSSRILYLGDRGARNWKRVEEDDNYSGMLEFSKMLVKIRSLIKKIPHNKIENIISFGPGVGIIDCNIINAIPNYGINKYIPIDINYFLAVTAVKRINDASPHIKIPFAIIDDFEANLSKISDVLNSKIMSNSLFMMLGGTFVNIEQNEISFLKGVNACMKERDYFLLDVFIKGNNYELSEDPYYNLHTLPLSARDFMAQGIEKIYRLNGHKKKNKSHISNNLEKYTTISCVQLQNPVKLTTPLRSKVTSPTGAN